MHQESLQSTESRRRTIRAQRERSRCRRRRQPAAEPSQELARSPLLFLVSFTSCVGRSVRSFVRSSILAYSRLVYRTD